jgi:hypothetical protein
VILWCPPLDRVLLGRDPSRGTVPLVSSAGRLQRSRAGKLASSSARCAQAGRP